MYINELAEIRIIVNTGSGYGHQKAAITLMTRLRELGFKGTFDLRYEESRPIAGKTGHALNALMPEFEPTPISVDKDPGKSLDETINGLGLMRITRLPKEEYYKDCFTSLPKTELTLTAADDSADQFTPRTPEKYHSAMYACLQPTDWKVGDRFVVQKGKTNRIILSDDLLLMCKTPFKAENLKEENLNAKEKRILDLVNSGDCYTQLVYTSNIEKTSSVNIIEQLINAHKLNLSRGISMDKPIILLCPRAEQTLTRLTEYHDLAQGVLTETELTSKKGQVIIANTGSLSPAFFHFLLESTSFPPLSEGANTTAYCETEGLPFIYCCDSREPFKSYDQVIDKKTQALHEYASRCLVTYDKKDIPFLANYLNMSLNDKKTMKEYHQDRAQKIKLQRPDICVAALRILGIDCELNAQLSQSRTRRNIQ